MLRLFKLLVSFISKKRQIQIVFLVFLTILSSFLEIFSIGAIFPLVSFLIDPDSILSYPFLYDLSSFLEVNHDEKLLNYIIVVFLFISTIAYLIKIALIYYRNEISSIISYEISSLMYWKILNQEYKYYSTQNTGDIITGLTLSSRIVTKFLLPTLKIINSFLMILMALAGMLIIKPNFTLIVFISIAIFYSIIGFLVKAKLNDFSHIQNSSFAYIIKLIQESLGAIKIIIINGTQRIFYNDYDRINRSYFKTISMTEFIGQIPKIIFEYLIILFIVLILFLNKNPENLVTLAPLIITFVLFIQKILPELSTLYRAFVSIKTSKDVINRIFNYLNLNDSVPSDINNIKPIKFDNKIEFLNVDFKYGKNHELIFSNLNMTIKKGQIIGLSGISGSGKSTLIDLICGLLKPTSGKLFVDGQIIDNSNYAEWRKNINVVTQNIFLFDTSIEQNIAYDEEKSMINFKKLNSVIELSELGNFVNKLEKGLKTNIGERGAKISGGQVQRIGISRALYNQAEILILDEATSAIDENTEKKIMRNIQLFSDYKTIIIISHRFSTLKICDLIFRINNNKLERYNSFETFIEKAKNEK